MKQNKFSHFLRCAHIAFNITMKNEEVLGGIRDFLLCTLMLVIGSALVCGWFMLWIWLYCITGNKLIPFGILIPVIPIALYNGKFVLRSFIHNFKWILERNS